MLEATSLCLRGLSSYYGRPVILRVMKDSSHALLIVCNSLESENHQVRLHALLQHIRYVGRGDSVGDIHRSFLRSRDGVLAYKSVWSDDSTLWSLPYATVLPHCIVIRYKLNVNLLEPVPVTRLLGQGSNIHLILKVYPTSSASPRPLRNPPYPSSLQLVLRAIPCHANRSPSCLSVREKEVALTAVEAARSLAALGLVCGEIEAQFSSASTNLKLTHSKGQYLFRSHPRLIFPFEVDLCYANVPSRSITGFWALQ